MAAAAVMYKQGDKYRRRREEERATERVCAREAGGGEQDLAANFDMAAAPLGGVLTNTTIFGVCACLPTFVGDNNSQ